MTEQAERTPRPPLDSRGNPLTGAALESWRRRQAWLAEADKAAEDIAAIARMFTRLAARVIRLPADEGEPGAVATLAGREGRADALRVLRAAGYVECGCTTAEGCRHHPAMVRLALDRDAWTVPAPVQVSVSNCQRTGRHSWPANTRNCVDCGQPKPGSGLPGGEPGPESGPRDWREARYGLSLVAADSIWKD